LKYFACIQRHLRDTPCEDPSREHPDCTPARETYSSGTPLAIWALGKSFAYLTLIQIAEHQVLIYRVMTMVASMVMSFRFSLPADIVRQRK
jgi:hypothetical protein